jgi:hypothetical protein
MVAIGLSNSRASSTGIPTRSAKSNCERSLPLPVILNGIDPPFHHSVANRIRKRHV